MTDAQKCKKNGWKIGDVLESPTGKINAWGVPEKTLIVITGIGYENILAVSILGKGEECVWSLQERRWRKR